MNIESTCMTTTDARQPQQSGSSGAGVEMARRLEDARGETLNASD